MEYLEQVQVLDVTGEGNPAKACRIVEHSQRETVVQRLLGMCLART